MSVCLHLTGKEKYNFIQLRGKIKDRHAHALSLSSVRGWKEQ